MASLFLDFFYFYVLNNCTNHKSDTNFLPLEILNPMPFWVLGCGYETFSLSSLPYQ